MPVIQGAADVRSDKQKLTQEEVNNTVEFCANAFSSGVRTEDEHALVKKLEEAGTTLDDLRFEVGKKPIPSESGDQTFLRSLILLAFECVNLNLQLKLATLELVNRFGRGFACDTDTVEKSV